METLEIVFGYSCYYDISKSNLNKNKILMFNALFNVGDLSKINKFKIKTPKELCYEKSNYNFKNEYKVINDGIKNKMKIRVWTSHYDIYSYLIMLYVCCIVKNKNYELYIIYSDDYNKDCLSPGMLKSTELEELTKLEHKLSQHDIEKYSYEWENIIKENSEMRVIENNKVKSVSISYYDSLILNKLKNLGKVKKVRLVASLMGENYLNENLYVYLIDKLIFDKKIKIIKKSIDRPFEDVIECIEN